MIASRHLTCRIHYLVANFTRMFHFKLFVSVICPGKGTQKVQYNYVGLLPFSGTKTILCLGIESTHLGQCTESVNVFLLFIA